MSFGDIWAVVKDDPSPTDSHVDSIMKPLCPKCGKRHAVAMAKSTEPFSFAKMLEGRFPSTPPSTLLQPVAALELDGQDAASPNFLPVAPGANSAAPAFGQNVTNTSDTPSPEATVPFHMPVPGLPALPVPQ